MCLPIIKVRRGERPVLVTPLPHRPEGKSLGDSRAVRPLQCFVSSRSKSGGRWRRVPRVSGSRARWWGALVSCWELGCCLLSIRVRRRGVQEEEILLCIGQDGRGFGPRVGRSGLCQGEQGRSRRGCRRSRDKWSRQRQRCRAGARKTGWEEGPDPGRRITAQALPGDNIGYLVGVAPRSWLENTSFDL